MTGPFDVVVVGAGHAGVQVVATLEKLGFEGSIGVFGDEESYPYERPPLSKDYLKHGGDAPLLRTEAYWADKTVHLHLSSAVTAVDAENKFVTLASGETVAYGSLVWAAGASARHLPIPGGDAENVLSIRRLEDIDRLRRHTPIGNDVVIIGGGYIGLETAAVLKTLGHRVTIVEALDRVLARVTSPIVSEFYQDLHREHGVRVELGAGVAGITTQGDLATSVELASGESLPADVVIVGIGVSPNVDALAAAGAAVENGVLIDERGRTSLPNVYAVGDCASQVTPFFAVDGRIRLESVPNANSSARAAAADIMNAEPQPAPVPWFWSNQYDVKMQTAGLFTGYDEVVCRGDIHGRKFSILYLKEGRLIAADCVNSPADFAQAKNLVGSFARLDPAIAADPSRPLKTSALELA